MRKLVVLLTLMLAFPASASAQDEMTRATFDLYLERFNAGDERYAELYDPGVVFEHAPQFGVLRGRQEIVEFYRGIRDQLEETVTASEVVIDNEQGVMAAELTTRLVATRDGVEMPSGTLDAGDMIITRGTVYYRLKDGRITHIRGGVQGAELILEDN